MRSTPPPSETRHFVEMDSGFHRTMRKSKVNKAARERVERRKTMAKLQKMVPTAKANDSPLELLIHVMEYISALQRQLEEDDMESENRAPPADVSELSQIFANFSTSFNLMSQKQHA
ncbi:unnamed protein product [Anisakis simplex]|uniref:BHLH domain-containing protein n=1 Tax=Anisakis simplex TaxID=6269 RepID=A0A0M3K205_ANISI|nr:unnamed protein product [Anisakis simplex]